MFSINSRSSEDGIPAPRGDGARKRGLIGVIDVGTTTAYFVVYTSPELKELLTVKEEIQLLTPKDGWFEEDPIEIMTAIYQCCAEACAGLPSRGYKREDIICVAVTNQRETTVLWDSQTGQPLYNAIIWNDIRTSSIADKILAKIPSEKTNIFKKLSGLPVSPYFSALKIKWLLENVPAVRQAIRSGKCKAGTLDTWIVWNLTKGKLHVTDVTNASRTMLMNIKTLMWDPILLAAFGIDPTILPQIRSSSEIYGRITANRCVLREVFICCIIGDQQASLVGQLCLERGQMNCSYNLGCFLLCNTGVQRVESARGLLTTVAYKMGPNARAVYALEGSVAVAGRAFDWLATKVRILPNMDEAENYAKSVPNTGGVYFVPAFTGLYAPYWRKSARGIIVGLTQAHTAKHIVRAAHEAICYQIRDILECMRRECGITPQKLHADGKLSQNKTLMQLQADIAGVPLSVSLRTDRTSLGAALCAAHAYSFDLSTFISGKQPVSHISFLPSTTNEKRDLEYVKWHRAVERSFGWTDTEMLKKTWRFWFYLFALLVATLAFLLYYAIENYDCTRMHMQFFMQPRRPRHKRRQGRKSC